MLELVGTSKDNEQFNIQLDRHTINRLEELAARFNMRRTQVAAGIIQTCMNVWVIGKEAEESRIKDVGAALRDFLGGKQGPPLLTAEAKGSAETKPDTRARKKRTR